MSNICTYGQNSNHPLHHNDTAQHQKAFLSLSLIIFIFLFSRDKANQHERVKDEQGVFTFLHKWIFLVNDQPLQSLVPHVNNLTHVTAVVNRKTNVQVIVCCFLPKKTQF